MCLISEEYVPCLHLTCRELWEGRFLGYILGMQESNIEDILNKRGMFKSHWEIQEKCLLDSVLYLPNLKFHPLPHLIGLNTMYVLQIMQLLLIQRNFCFPLSPKVTNKHFYS